MRARSTTFMVLATALWGGHYIMSGVAVTAMSPVSLVYFRWLLAVVPLIVVAQLIEKPDWRQVVAEWPRLVMLAALGMIGYNLFLYLALGFTTPVGASLVNAANPAVMALLAVVLTGDRVRLAGALGIAVSLVGVLVLLSHGSLRTVVTLDFNFGQLLMVGAVVVWSLYSIYGGKLTSVPPIASTAAQAAVVAVAMAPVAFATGARVPTEVAPLSALLFIAILPSVGSYVLWNMALRDVAPSAAAIFLNLITVFAVIIGLLLGQPLTMVELLGGAIVVSGVVVTSTFGARSWALGRIARLAHRRRSRQTCKPTMNPGELLA